MSTFYFIYGKEGGGGKKIHFVQRGLTEHSEKKVLMESLADIR